MSTVYILCLKKNTSILFTCMCIFYFCISLHFTFHWNINAVKTKQWNYKYRYCIFTCGYIFPGHYITIHTVGNGIYIQSFLIGEITGTSKSPQQQYKLECIHLESLLCSHLNVSVSLLQDFWFYGIHFRKSRLREVCKPKQSRHFQSCLVKILSDLVLPSCRNTENAVETWTAFSVF